MTRGTVMYPNLRLKNRSGACRVIASPRIESKLLSMAQKQRRRS